MSKKTFSNADISDAKASTEDLQVLGNGDLWQLLCKVSSKSEGWMKSTKVLEVTPEYEHESLHTVKGCLVQVTTQQGECVAEALVYIPDVKISECGMKLVSAF